MCLYTEVHPILILPKKRDVRAERVQDNLIILVLHFQHERPPHNRKLMEFMNIREIDRFRGGIKMKKLTEIGYD